MQAAKEGRVYWQLHGAAGCLGRSPLAAALQGDGGPLQALIVSRYFG
jgi:hypothetical protein